MIDNVPPTQQVEAVEGLESKPKPLISSQSRSQADRPQYKTDDLNDDDAIDENDADDANDMSEDKKDHPNDDDED